MMRAKFKLQELTRYEGGNGKLVFQAVTSGSKENDEFFKYTPSGKIEMTLVSGKVLDMLEAGGEYYIDFTQVESEPK